jgi:hypothetical protein
MSRADRVTGIAAGLVLAWWCGVVPAVADLANVFPKQASPLRGDVTWTADEIVIRNAAGEVRFKKEQVERVEWLTATETVEKDLKRRFNVLRAGDIKGHFALAEWLREKERFDLLKVQCRYILGLEPDHRNAKLLLELAQSKLIEQANVAAAEGQASGEAKETEGLPEPPLLSDEDIKRLKLYEYPLDGRPEKVFVKFVRKKGYADVERIVRKDLGLAGKLDPQAERILERGQPHEKLQLILQTTGLKYADRIEIRGEPEVFQTFRRRILPLVAKGCAKSGCHGAREAQVFRLPRGPRSKDDVAYTSFLILDQLQTEHGPLIDRDLPGNSALLSFMLPPEELPGDEESRYGHPPVEKGRFVPVLRNTRDPDFNVVLDWLNSLNVPHPPYELEYEFPDWLKTPAAATQPAEEGAEPDEETGEQKPGGEEPSEGSEEEKEQPAGGGGGGGGSGDGGGELP